MGFVTNSQLKQEQQALVDNLKKGKLIPSNSVSAKSLDPVSEESGTIQDEAFIAQGTGTANGTASVDVPPVAKNLEKQGNTVVVNQKISDPTFNGTTGWFSDSSNTLSVSNNIGTVALGTSGTLINFYTTFDTGVSGHKYLITFKLVDYSTAPLNLLAQLIKTGWSGAGSVSFYSVTKNNTYYCVISALDVPYIIRVSANGTFSAGDTLSITSAYTIDLTQWFNGNVPQDLIDHPENFGRYYAGSLAYNAGTLTDTTGRYLVCTVGKDGGHSNLWDEQWEHGSYYGDGQPSESSYNFRTKNPIIVIPNSVIHFYYGSANADQILYWYFYDNNDSFISGIYHYGTTFTENVPSNARFMRFRSGGSLAQADYAHDITISLYYSPEQGGEGYDAYYPYVAPKVYDTGTETLKAFDYRTSDGVVHTETGEVDLGTLNYVYDDVSEPDHPRFYTFGLQSTIKALTSKIISTKYIYSNESITDMPNLSFRVSGDGTLYLKDSAYTDASTLKTALNGVKLQYELATPTTTQGTPFAENIEDDDYGMMYWLDTDNELVETPQGCKIFYPANYSLWLDTAYARTEGDATSIALTDEISDAALNARGYYKMQDLLTTFGANGMVGGTLKQQLAAKESLDFDNLDCVDLGNGTWHKEYYSTANKNHWYCQLGSPKANSKILCTKYKSDTKGNIYGGSTAICVGGSNDNIFYLYDPNFDNSTSTSTDLANALKGVLVAYEKAST